MNNIEQISSIKNGDDGFPESLRGIPSAPKILYYRGKLPGTDEKFIAVVGSRVCSDYGKRIANDICQGLTSAGAVIISGLAPGIDTLAHAAAVTNRNRTIAVLGTGIDKPSIYPQSNLDLSDGIVNNGGCLLTEYPNGTRGAKFTFPQRNRIIAGLSMATVVIEAKLKGGSLITANLAKKYGKPVFAVPGPVYSLNSEGCNDLIRQGATLVRNAKDILSALNLSTMPEPGKQQINAGSPEERSILEALSEEALEIDKIIIKTKLPAQIVLSIIPVLEIKGSIKNIGGMKYYSNR